MIEKKNYDNHAFRCQGGCAEDKPCCQEGKGLWDALEEAKKRVKAAIAGPRLDLPPQLRKWMEVHGEEPIRTIMVCRKPIIKAVDIALNLISRGEWQKNKNRFGYEDLFHLWMLVKTDKGSYKVEKNHVVSIVDSSDTGKDQDVEKRLVKRIGLRQMFDNAVKKYGARRIFVYQPPRQNCQYFTSDMLTASGLNNPATEKFIKQDANAILGNTPKGDSLTSKIGDAVTDLAGRADILMNGVGKKSMRGFGSLKVEGPASHRFQSTEHWMSPGIWTPVERPKISIRGV